MAKLNLIVSNNIILFLLKLKLTSCNALLSLPLITQEKKTEMNRLLNLIEASLYGYMYNYQFVGSLYHKKIA